MIFLPLILAHLIGDFILQPQSWVADKEAKKLKSKFLYFHILIHFILSFVFLWNVDFWWIALLVALSHFIIDACKLIFQNAANKKKWFLIDQILHLAVILGLSFYIEMPDFTSYFTEENFKILAAVIFLTTPASIFIKILLSSWSPIAQEENSVQTESLTNAGKYIGILERLMVFTFIAVNHWEGVGFMVAAKSVFRFSDLAQAKQRKLTEYVLIGTLLSFGMAVFAGILIK